MVGPSKVAYVEWVRDGKVTESRGCTLCRELNFLHSGTWLCFYRLTTKSMEGVMTTLTGLVNILSPFSLLLLLLLLPSSFFLLPSSFFFLISSFFLLLSSFFLFPFYYSDSKLKL